MQKVVEKFLIENNISSCLVAVGFSAGPDSVALATILNELKDKFNLELVLAYFNHMWRKEALFEEEFTLEFAKKIGAKTYIKRAIFEGKQTEETARDLRYEFFQNCSKEFNLKHIFLAHNKNDNIETLVYRLIKGTSINGLRAIPKVRDIFYRPLLDVQKSEILDFLKERKLEFMVDSSNDDTKYKRNLIRHEILPLFEKINPKYLNSIENLIINSKETYEIVQNSIEKTKKEIFIDENNIDYYKFISLQMPYRLEILNDFIGKYLKYRNRKNLLMYDDFILQNKHSKISLNSDYFLRTRWKKIFIEKVER